MVEDVAVWWHTRQVTLPWETESDFVEWDEEQTGLHCTMIRAQWGQWCGYVTLPEGHPWHGLHMMDIEAVVHGGVTWSDYSLPGAAQAWDADTVAEALARAEEGNKTWVIGFDCAHGFDLVPKTPSGGIMNSWGTYRTEAYVRSQCELLALQVMAALPQ